MKIIKIYYYFFYQLYKFWEWVSYPKFWSDFKAVVSIVVLEIYSIYSVLFYYSYFTNMKLKLEDKNLLNILVCTIIIGLNYFVFIHTDKWKEYNAEFDKLPKKKNIIYGIIVWVIIITIIVNMFTSIDLIQTHVLGM